VTDDEPVAVPDETPREPAPPAWLKESEEVAPPVESGGGNDESADILVSLVANIHDKAAEATRYDGWRLSDNDIKLWTKVLRFLLKKLPSKDWPLAIAVVSLAISESMKFVGYMKFRRETMPAHVPIRGPPPAPAEEPEEREHHAFVGKPAPRGPSAPLTNRFAENP
jgi:hypothetical protein